MRKFSRGFAMIQVMIVTVFAATFVYLSMLHEINKNTKAYHEEAIVTLFPVAYSFIQYAVAQIPTSSDFDSSNYYKTESTEEIANIDDTYYAQLENLGFDAQTMSVNYSNNMMTFTWDKIRTKDSSGNSLKQTPQRVTIIAKGLAEKLTSTLNSQGYTFDATVVTKTNEDYTIQLTFHKA